MGCRLGWFCLSIPFDLDVSKKQKNSVLCLHGLLHGGDLDATSFDWGIFRDKSLRPNGRRFMACRGIDAIVSLDCPLDTISNKQSLPMASVALNSDSIDTSSRNGRLAIPPTLFCIFLPWMGNDIIAVHHWRVVIADYP